MGKIARIAWFVLLFLPRHLGAREDFSPGWQQAGAVTPKPIKVQSLLPKFLRQGDHLEFPVQIVNGTDSELTGEVHLELTNADTRQSVDGWFSNRQANQYFTAGPRQSATVYFPIDVPYEYNEALHYKVDASSGRFSDSEESVLPVLNNRILVTEALPMHMSQGGTREFRMENLLRSAEQESLSHYALRVEFATRPAWYALGALPWLMDYPYACAEQGFNRFYAAALGSYIVQSSPDIRNVLERWGRDTAALRGHPDQNSDYPLVQQQETPWVLDAHNEHQEHRMLARLANLPVMEAEMDRTARELESIQSPSGGIPWFSGGREDRFVTQYILTGIGRLRKMEAIPPTFRDRVNVVARKALDWCDRKSASDYRESLKAQKSGREIPLAAMQAQWLFMRSFFPEYTLDSVTGAAQRFYLKKAGREWKNQARFVQAMLALCLYRAGDDEAAKEILASLRKNAILSSDKGMYWKDMGGGCDWRGSPLEAAALLMEAYAEIDHDESSVSALKTWLLSKKLTRHWAGTRATADACYALLMRGGDWQAAEPVLQIGLGRKELGSRPDKQQEGTGYFSASFAPPFIRPDMGEVRVTLSPSPAGTRLAPAWGSLYWQYFKEMERVPQERPGALLSLSKQIFLKKSSPRGSLLVPIAENGELKTGDLLTVRILLKTGQAMEYVQVKDQRASCLEPVRVVGGYQRKSQLDYYEETLDASTNLFFGLLPKGTHVFEYDVRVTSAGTFSGGIATAGCMDAPEFSAASGSTRINVERPD